MKVLKYGKTYTIMAYEQGEAILELSNKNDVKDFECDKFSDSCAFFKYFTYPDCGKKLI